MATVNDDKKCCNTPEGNREGTSLLTRFLPQLDPANAPVDPRTTQDILVFAKRYADLVKYYDINDTIDWVNFEEGEIVRPCNEDPAHNPNQTGTPVQQQAAPLAKKKGQVTTWKEFFYNDIAVVIASIAQWKNKLYLIKKEYNKARKDIETTGNKEKEQYRELVKVIIHHLERIHRWYGKSVSGHPLQKELEVKIKSFLAPALKQLIAYDKGMLLQVMDDLDLVSHYETFKAQPWNIDFNKVDADGSVYVGDTLKKKIIYALMYVDDIFNTLYKVYEELTRQSGYYWQHAIEQYPSHQPHMALFISFVELFSFATQEMNGLTKRHLEYYYRDVLHLKEKPPVPDSVYLTYQLAKGVDEYPLEKGRELSAGKDALGKQLIYKTDKELVINKAKVKELKTLFLDKSSPIKNIYAAPVANSADGKGEKFKDPETAWSTFGYFEPRDTGDKITGEEARFGLAISSPQLLLDGGERTIILTLSFTPGSVDAAFESSKIDDELVNIFFSGAKEWVQPEPEAELEVKLGRNTFLYSAETEQRILHFINSAKTPEDIAGVERQDGPVFDNPLTTGAKKVKDYDIGIDLAKLLIGKNFISLADLEKVKGLGKDKLQDLIYTFSNQFVCWNKETNQLTIKVTLHTSQDAIVAFNAEKLKENYPSEFPLCKLLFSADGMLYEQFKKAQIENIDVFVKVDGLTSLIIQTDDGPADPKKNVFPYSAFPQVSSSFSIGSNEFIGKKLNTLTLRAEWIGDLNFADRYKTYNYFRIDPKNFSTGVELYYDNKWNTTDLDSLELFSINDDGTTSNQLLLNIPAKNKPLPAEAIAANNSQIIKFTLNAPDFGHEEFPFLAASQLANRLNYKGEPIDASDNEGPVITAGAKPKKAPPPLEKLIYVPKTPYTPQAKLFSVSYTSAQTVSADNSRLFHIYPFGEAEIFTGALFTGKAVEPLFDDLMEAEKKTNQLIIPTNFLLPCFKFGNEVTVVKKLKEFNEQVSKKYDDFKKKNYFLLNQYESATDQQGNLYIGIENLDPPQNLSLLFKFADGTAYDNDSEPPKIHWSYLVNNEWITVPADHIVTDTTYGFQTTGIILFDFPANATNNNTLLTTGLYWLCASIDSGANKVPKLIDVIAQANQATFADNENDPAHFAVPLPEKTISKPLVKIPEVKLIEQPFESFDGKPKEQGRQFYQRVSERLRHKGRAITPSDYEHMVLEQFPSVYKVKILSHTDPRCLCRHENEPPQKDDCCCAQPAPGHVLIIPVSNVRNKNAIDPLKPRTGRRTLLKIEEYFKKRVSPFVKVHAKNPTFEEVKVSFSVKFYTGVDKGFYLKKLNEDIIRHLTPWAFDSNSEILFGNKIYASKVINAIEDFDYVDYITCFRMIHVAEGCCDGDSLKDMECDEMQINLEELSDDVPTEKELKEYYLERFTNEVSAISSRSILVSAKQHCISLIEDEPEDDNCNCKPAAAAAKKTK